MTDDALFLRRKFALPGQGDRGSGPAIAATGGKIMQKVTARETRVLKCRPAMIDTRAHLYAAGVTNHRKSRYLAYTYLLYARVYSETGFLMIKV